MAGAALLLATGLGLALLGPDAASPVDPTEAGSDEDEDPWPLRGRVTVTEQHEDGDHHDVFEFAAEDWDDWVLVQLGTARGEGPLEGPARVLRFQKGQTAEATMTVDDFGGAFDTLKRTPHAEYETVESSEEKPLHIPPLQGVVGTPDFDEVQEIPPDALPERRTAVADQLGLDRNQLEAALLDIGHDDPIELVWLAEADLVLDWRDEWSRTEVTELELGQGLPTE